MLYGRGLECAAIDSVLRRAREGTAGALLLRGEAGIGKSALLDYAAGQADGMLVLRARGVEAEAQLAFAGLHALLRPAIGQIADLPSLQGDAIRGALGLAETAGQGRFLVSAGLVGLLSRLAETRPVVCLVDDIQWLDAESLDALAFALHRFEADPVAMLFAVRDDEAGAAEATSGFTEVPEVVLGPLDEPAVAQLMDDRLPLSLDHRVRQRVVSAARGNPLALVELSAENALRASDPDSGHLPLSARLERTYLKRVQKLPQPTQDMLLLASADESGDVGLLLAAGRELGLAEGDLGPAERALLVRVEGSGLEFMHPLVRSAVYRRATFADRRRAHLALAAALATADAARAVWHRAAAAVFPDEAVADALEEVAGAAQQRAALGAAAQTFERASALTADPSRRAALLVSAAEASWEIGHTARAGDLVERARETAVEPALRARVDHLRGRLEVQTGVVLEGFEILMAGAARVADHEPHRAAAMLVDAVRAASYEGDFARVVLAGQRAQRLDTGGGLPPAAAFVSGVSSLLTGDAATAAPLLKAAMKVSEESADPALLVWAGTASAFLGDYAGARSYGASAAARARESGALGTLANALEVVSIAELPESLAMAEADATEGLRLARETGQPPCAALHLSTLAVIRALRGEEDEARACAEQVFALAARHGHAFPEGRAKAALGLLDLSLGRPAQALDRLEQLVTSTSHPAVAVTAAADLIEAAVRADRPDRAASSLELLTLWVAPSGAPMARSLVARCRALLSTGSEAAELFEESLDLQGGRGESVDLARTQLLYGEFLRRERRRGQARRHLRAAWDVFERLGAVPWAERARIELRATGETARPRPTSRLAELTPQELQIARLVAGGASTKEVAAQLFLSPRTVEYHLRKVFTKTGISARGQLRTLDLDG